MNLEECFIHAFDAFDNMPRATVSQYCTYNLVRRELRAILEQVLVPQPISATGYDLLRTLLDETKYMEDK